jgi:uncharacterized protein YbjT (DUF2867 family)
VAAFAGKRLTLSMERQPATTHGAGEREAGHGEAIVVAILAGVLDVLIFGGTGSAGRCVLRECLASSQVGRVRAISRRPLDLQHEKLTTVLHDNYTTYDAVKAAFEGVDVCLYCLGKSVSQVEHESAYRRITYEFAVAAAAALRDGSPDAVFHFISGGGASLDSRFMWARVKAETERDLLGSSALTLCWRPAAIDGMPSPSEPLLYRAARPLYAVLKPFRSLYVNGADLGLAMIQASVEGMHGRIIENREIRDLADRARALKQLDAIRRR